MLEKTISLALALGAGLLSISGPVLAIDSGVAVLHGQAVATAASITRDEGGTGVAVHRGAVTFVPAAPARAASEVTIDGERIAVDRLEPVGDWFLDRSQEDLVIVHCYTRQSVYVGGGRRILCDARRL
jgi:hypothetical protein